MDKQLLSALNSLSTSLDAISEALAKKGEAGSATSNALSSGDFGKQLIQISKNIEEIKGDNKKILKNTETILELSKSKTKEDSGLLGNASNKEGLKQGVGMILLIAGGILSLGLAFKVIGDVDFSSVIALSVSLPLVAMAFEKISVLKDLTPGNILSVMMVTTGISLAILAASYILSSVRPIGILQGLTSIMIAGVFAAIGPSISSLINSFRGISIMGALKAMVGLPLVLLSISTAIYLSSYVLGKVRPIGILQAMTGILIAGMFAVISLSVGKLINGFAGLKSSEVALVKGDLPWMLVGIATAITASSFILGFIRPIGFLQFLTAVAIAVVFIPISYAVGPIIKSLKDISPSDILKLPFILVTMAGAITASSYILNSVNTIPISTLFNIVLQSLALAVSSFALGSVFGIIGKIPISNIITGALSVVVISGAIMASSLLLGMGQYDKYPGIEWSLGSGASLLAFGLSTVAIGLVVASGIGAVALLAGAAAVILVSGTIVTSSYILSKGVWGSYPSLGWASGVGVSLVAFGTSMVALGTLIVGTLGIGAGILIAGREGVKMVANTIVDVGGIISRGNFSGGPKIEWATATGLSMVAFATSIVTLGTLGLFGSNIIDNGKTAVLSIATTIVDVAKILGTGNFSGGPTDTWAKGIFLSLSAFAPIYAMLMTSKIISFFGGSGVTPEKFKEAIKIITDGIVEVSGKFKGVVFSNGPTDSWAKGVGSAITAFAPVYENLGKRGLFSKSVSVEDMSTAILAISSGIVKSSLVLGLGNYGKTIPSDYISNMSKNIKQYIDLVKYIQSSGIGGSELVDSISVTFKMGKMIDSYDRLAKSIRNLSSSISTIDTDKLMALKSLTGNVVLMSLMDPEQFEKMMDAMDAKASKFVNVMDVIDEGKSRSAVTIGTKSNVVKSESKEIIQKMDVLIKQMADIASVVGSNGSLKDYLEGLHHPPKIGQTHYAPN